MAASIKTKGLLGAGIVAGLGIGVGKAAFDALGDALHQVTSIIPDAIHSGQEFIKTVDDISDKTGASAENASRFAGTLQYLGISTSGLGTSLKTLSVEIATNEDKFTKLGIATRNANKEPLDTITILGNLRTYLSNAGDGYTKLAIASDLLGKSAGDLIDYLNLTDAEALALNQTMDELGVTISEAARKDIEKLGRETNLLGLAWQGLSNTLATEAAPTIRRVIGGITSFIKENGAAIRQTFLDITNAVLGFISGLVGAANFTPFQMQLDGMATSGKDITLSFEQWAQQTGRTIPVVEKLTGSTKAGTSAIDKQIKSLDKRIASERASTETALAAIDAQEKQLDLAEQQINIDERKRELNDQLNQSQLDLLTAQGKGDAQGVSDAMAKIADIQAQQAEDARQLGVDAQRDKLQMQRDEINAKAKAREDELNGLKAQLQEQRSAVQAAASASVSDNAKTLATLKADYDKYLSDQKLNTHDTMFAIKEEVAGDPAKGTGLGGSIAKAFADGQAAGETFRLFLTDTLGPAIEGIFQFFVDIKTKIDEIANSDVWKFLTDPVDIGRGPTPEDINNFLNGGSGVDPNDLNNRKNRGNGLPSQGSTIVPSLSGSVSGTTTTNGRPLAVTVVSQLDGREVARSTSLIQANEYSG